MKVYSYPLSGHSHRVRLFLSLIGIDHEVVDVDLSKGAQKSPEFLLLNRFGQVPVLDDDGTIITDSNAILVYLAKKFGERQWLPEQAAAAAAVQRWLSVAAGEVANGPARARLITVFGAPYHPEDVIPKAHAILGVINEELAGRLWLAVAHPTIADVSLYGYIARAPEGNVDLSPYANVRAWLARVERLSRFVPLQKTHGGLSAIL